MAVECKKAKMNGKFKDISQQRFGRLTALHPTEERRSTQVVWECECECGRVVFAQGNTLRDGRTRSCGCLKRERMVETHTTHGHSPSNGEFSPTYRCWDGMVSRTTNPNHGHWKYYGGKGVRTCERWRKFQNFLADMGEKPGKDYHIHRLNSDGNYEKSNCVWMQKSEHLRHHGRCRKTKHHQST